MTNYEKIKDMSIEELAKFLAGKFECLECPCSGKFCDMPFDCDKSFHEWLESEAIHDQL